MFYGNLIIACMDAASVSFPSKYNLHKLRWYLIAYTKISVAIRRSTRKIRKVWRMQAQRASIFELPFAVKVAEITKL